MPFDQPQRQAMLRERAGSYAHVALANITREYPHMPYFVATGPGPYPTHREFHPAFYGCFDWHSCVEMHWVIVRLLRLVPAAVEGQDARATLDELLTPANIAAEIDFFSDPNHRSLERPYGWGWLLTLYHELTTWDAPDGQRWARAVRPLADLLTTKLLAWLPLLTYPQRTGVHPNTAFGLSRAYDHAKLRAAHGDDALLTAIHAAASRWFLDDVDYPARYEPSGGGFSLARSLGGGVDGANPCTVGSPWLARAVPSRSRGMSARVALPTSHRLGFNGWPDGALAWS